MNNDPPIYIKPDSKTRNLPCPCQSGLKLKKCCGSGAKSHAFNQWLDERQREARSKRLEELDVRSVGDSSQSIYGFAEQRHSPIMTAMVIGSVMAMSGGGLLQPPIRPKRRHK
jgi:hypothetical protein